MDWINGKHCDCGREGPRGEARRYRLPFSSLDLSALDAVCRDLNVYEPDTVQAVHTPKPAGTCPIGMVLDTLWHRRTRWVCPQCSGYSVVSMTTHRYTGLLLISHRYSNSGPLFPIPQRSLPGSHVCTLATGRTPLCTYTFSMVPRFRLPCTYREVCVLYALHPNIVHAMSCLLHPRELTAPILTDR
ncbi:hypothetical protein C8R44DRAFT_885428 [Mycena epipterygia]|nr:hypothetical protein C8R44DRAFT_885428 [Mycena epipterygia]